jgi:hypothetical protein
VNCRLYGFSERAWLFEDLKGEDAAEQLAHTRRRMSNFVSSARLHGTVFREMNNKGRHGCIGQPQPSAVRWVSETSRARSLQTGLFTHGRKQSASWPMAGIGWVCDVSASRLNGQQGRVARGISAPGSHGLRT